MSRIVLFQKCTNYYAYECSHNFTAFRTKRKRNFGSWRGRGKGKKQGLASKKETNSSPTKRSRYAASRTKVATATNAGRGSQGVRRQRQVAAKGSTDSLLLQRPKQQAQPFLPQSRVVRF